MTTDTDSVTKKVLKEDDDPQLLEAFNAYVKPLCALQHDHTPEMWSKSYPIFQAGYMACAQAKLFSSNVESNKPVLYEESQDVAVNTNIYVEFNKHAKVLCLEASALYDAFKVYDKLVASGHIGKLIGSDEITNTEPDSWSNTAAELTAITYEMDVIHERYSGKENRAEREELLTPLRAKCIAIGKRRQALVNVKVSEKMTTDKEQTSQISLTDINTIA